MPKFSVLLPTRDRRDWIRRAVRSVQAQTLEDWELIVHDVGTDTVEDLIEPDPRITYSRGPCQGPALDFQACLDRATGEIVTPLADDDRLPSHALGTVNDQIGDNEWLNGRTVLVDEAGEPLHLRGGSADHVAETREGHYMLGGAIYWRKTLTDLLGGFDAAFDGAADFELYRRFLTHSDPVLVTEVLYIHSVWPGQDSVVQRDRQADAARRVNADTR